ncbi:SoxR reducing system RseC family protein [Curtobacterium sp. MCBD17_021]|uniref:SoxR reducing system RseC family protein n=1 Tax=Curtobacterium sp. MCBD17_021 TaxID=2175665 RepID=UPI000DAA7046|nr:SoxR reducing system RseC family protein [Curtobacterium sp. MCBD17_021]PZE64817.1 hypothetical protein DEI83_11185 [Curtobacterium sp. MCBD17_021]
MTVVGAVRTRVVDGPHRWGRLDVRPVGRTMWATRTLVVYPPGTDRRERALLRAAHSWPLAGLVLTGVVAVTWTAAPALGAVVGLVGYALGFLVLRWATRRVRPLVRALTVTTFHGNGRPEVHGDARLMAVALGALSSGEDELRAGRTDPVGFEAVWAEVWNALPAR